MTRPMDNLKIRIAPGADLTADRSTWTWVDITPRVHSPVTITHGRSSESAQPGPDTFEATVENADGALSPDNPLGPWYGDLDEGTPLQVYWDTTDNIRFEGNITALPIRWRVPSVTATSTIQASGPLERMEQGAQALDSPLFRALSQHDNVVAYWPCEDGSDADSAASPIMGVNPWPIVGEFAAIDGPPGSKQLVRVESGTSSTMARVPNHTPGDYYVVELAWRMDEVLTGGRSVMNVFTTSSDLAQWRITVSDTTFLVRAFDSDGSTVVNSSETIHPDLIGQWIRVELFLSDNVTTGSSFRARLVSLDSDLTELNNIGNSNVGTGTSIGRIVRVGVGAGGVWGQDRFFGHVAVLTPTTPSSPSVFFLNASDIPFFHAPYHGFTGELAADRFDRLCDEEGLTCSVVAPTGGLQLPGEIGSNASTPDAASLDITGDIDVRAWLTRDQWLFGNDGDAVSKYDYGGERSWRFGIGNDGEIYFRWTTDGTSGTESVVESDPVVPTPEGNFWEPGKGAFIAVRATLDVDDGSSQHVGTIYTGPSLDGPWTQIHTETLAGTTSIFSGGVALRVGANDVDADLFGMVRQARVYDGIDGTLVASPDFAAQEIGATSFDDAQGNTWTVNGDAAIVRAHDSMPMGPQQIDTLIANLRDVASADGGRLTEHMGGFRYRVRSTLYNQEDALTVTPQPHMPVAPEPTRDNQRIRNDITASSPFGTSVRATDQASIEKRGRLEDAITVNPETADQLQQIAWWRLHIGTVPGMRWPSLPLRLSPSNTDLIATWLAVRLGDRITVDHTFTQIPGVDVNLLVEGWTESWDAIQWDVVLNCVPASPYDVAVFGTSRFDTAGSETSGSFDAGTDTSLTVFTGTDGDGLRLWGGDGDYASTPDHASLDITGDIDVRAWLLTTETKLPRRENLVTKWEQITGDQQSYSLTWEADRTLRFWWTTDGSDATQANVRSDEPTPVPSPTGLAVRVAVDVDNGSADADVTFYTAPTLDGPWTQLGTVQNPGSTISLFAGTAPLVVGTQDPSAATDTFRGTVRAAQVRDGINGTVAANPDFSIQAAGTTSFADSTGKTWTVQGDAHIFHTPLWVNSTDHPGEFPFEVQVSGVRLNVTAISGTDPEQVFTVDQAPANGVAKTIPSGSAVSLSPRPVFAL